MRRRPSTILLKVCVCIVFPKINLNHATTPQHKGEGEPFMGETWPTAHITLHVWIYVRARGTWVNRTFHRLVNKTHVSFNSFSERKWDTWNQATSWLFAVPDMCTLQTQDQSNMAKQASQFHSRVVTSALGKHAQLSFNCGYGSGCFCFLGSAESVSKSCSFFLLASEIHIKFTKDIAWHDIEAD